MKRLILLAAAVLLIIACTTEDSLRRASPTSTTEWTGDPVVETRYGRVRGFGDEGDTWVWKAIPFARPPVGELRWKAPREPEPWDGVLSRRRFSDVAPQFRFWPKRGIKGSEDCLYLNVWRPRNGETDLPVYVWIHGGGNSTGSAGRIPDYYGNRLASQAGIVFVSVNYRLGPFGWFTHPALRTGNPADDSGNYGTLDLIQSLEWVRDNIAAFGGDPGNVLIAGESAGGINVLSLLLSPEASGLFHKAMVQSGALISQPVKSGEEKGREVLLRLIGEDRRISDGEAEVLLERMTDGEIAEFLRSRPAKTILRGYEKAVAGMISFPYLFEDGSVIPYGGYDAISDGRYNAVPLIIGGTKEEIKLFMMLQGHFPEREELYQRVAGYGSDLWKAGGVDAVARTLRQREGQPPIYVYQLCWGAPNEAGESPLPRDLGLRLGASHGIDVPFFHGSDSFYGRALGSLITTRANEPGRKALSLEIMGYLANFMRCGDPNSPQSPVVRWEPWSNERNGPKSVLFDVDGDVPDIRMSTKEVTAEAVMDRMEEELSEELYREAQEYLTSGSGLSRLAGDGQ